VEVKEVWKALGRVASTAVSSCGSRMCSVVRATL
jgi:hypothetical protein